MNKIKIIAEREFRARTAKKSYWLLTFIGPIVSVIFMVVPVWMASKSAGKIELTIVDNSTRIAPLFKSDNVFLYRTPTLTSSEINEPDKNILVIPSNILESTQPVVQLIGDEKNKAVLTRQIQLVLYNAIVSNRNYHPKVKVAFEPKQSQENGDLQTFLGYGGVVIIYFFIFLYSSHLMKGVLEEKNSKIIDVLLSAAKPIEILWGKLLGIGLAGIIQFIIWLMSIVLISYSIYHYFDIGKYNEAYFSKTLSTHPSKALFAYQMKDIVSGLNQLNVVLLVLCFTFYFIIGYLIYGAIFTVIGALSDSDTETQQYSVPVTIPLLSTMLLISNILYQPEGVLSQILSYIPLTAPVAMVARSPFLIGSTYFYWEWLMSAVGCVAFLTLVLRYSAVKYRNSLVHHNRKVL